MIAPMKKYTFLAYHRDYDEFLKKLRDIGVVHIIEKAKGEINDAELATQVKIATELKNSINQLKSMLPENAETKNISADSLEILNDIKSINTDINYFDAQINSINKTLKSLEPWGDYSLKHIRKIAEAGYQLKLYTCAKRKFNQTWLNDYTIEIINDTSNQVIFFIITRNNKNINIEADEFILPTTPLEELKKELADFENHKKKAEKILLGYALNNLSSLENTLAELDEEIKFKNVKLNTSSHAENILMIIEGWVPAEKEAELNEMLSKEAVYFESVKPGEKDQVPVLLKNKKILKLFEPIGELYTFPDYKELDLTPFFAPFYMLFFGFCLGDLGYGVLITLAALIGIRKAPQKLKALMKLGVFLGIATMVMGLVSGTFFGIMLHPDDFESTKTLPTWLRTYQEFILSSDNLMILSLALGYVQVLLGMFINAINRARMYGFKHSLSQLGWNILVLVTLPAFALFHYDALLPQAISKNIFIISGLLGAIPAFLYNSPGKNPLLNFGIGMWNLYLVASGLLGDVLSYIRLFALGLSSAILGNVFNQLALQSSQGVDGIFGILILVLILAVGHSLNFFMAVLGSFVHPLRLTFVEFYKNAGFIGGGQKYEPFKKSYSK